MRSAYLVLGVPGDASQEEIESAFRRAEAQFPRQRLADEKGALERLDEIRAAHQVLKDPDSRAAHDRKLQAQMRPAARPPQVVRAEEPAPLRKVLIAGVWMLVLVLGAGFYVSHRNAESRRIAAEQELADRKAAEREAEEKRVEQERIAAERRVLAARAADNERRLVLEAQASSSRAAANIRMQEAAAVQAQRTALVESQRRESDRLGEERRAAAEARQRVERDKQRVREICYQVYRRPDC